MLIERYFTKLKKNTVFDCFNWEKKDVEIADDSGKVMFVQKEVEFPDFWSALARKITSSKYFYGAPGTNERENSLKQLIWRVSSTFRDWSLKQKYMDEEEAKIFEEEIAFVNISQLMAFNSPVWFNVGLHKISKDHGKDQRDSYVVDGYGEIIKMPIGKEKEYPQTSACFIQEVEDTMESIMDLAKKEAMLFKYGSGTGSNISTLRSSKEKLSGGGKPSGPLAYWQFWDKVAGIVKSGGKTRRAAKMDILNVDHPDILEFIESKKREEEKMHILIDKGVDWREAQDTVSFQNTNISVRATDNFMEAVAKDEDWQTVPVHNKDMASQMPKYKAKELMKKIAEATHFCGDPGMQFHDTINKWHTCPNSGKINGSNPCSEYMFVDNSSCNLASLNLMRFIKNDQFDIESFGKAVKITSIAQDLEFDNSSFPTKEIAENSHKFRPLGMGYANLGSLIMSLGLAYDSDEARNLAAVITALMTGKVYETSTEIAERVGCFKEFYKNKEPMMKVIHMHRQALDKINLSKLPENFKEVFNAAVKTWDNVIERGEKFGFRNAQATVLAPTGTIGFMMDADTKGIEPEIGLVQFKLLSDGGVLKLVNNTIEKTLTKLGYSSDEIKAIIKHIEKEETIEGAPGLKEEHLPIFDCANKPKNGKRTIHYSGHIKMMAAVQPFLSGAISKTVNLPKEATVEEIEKVYMEAWKLGLKAVALYRDESKRFQPLSFSKKEKKEEIIEERPLRKKLPSTRSSLTHKFRIANHEGYLTFGLYPEGGPGELFINMSKEGSTIGGLMDTIGTLVSISLQYGVSIEDLAKKFRHQKFEPRGVVFEGHKDIKTAESIIDYIGQFMELVFVNSKIKDNLLVHETIKGKVPDAKLSNFINTEEGELGGFCNICGTQMIKRGHCIEECPSCHYQNQNGCGS
jgi:ribonucleoside-diphosphate reductase alpha chain